MNEKEIAKTEIITAPQYDVQPGGNRKMGVDRAEAKVLMFCGIVILHSMAFHFFLDELFWNWHLSPILEVIILRLLPLVSSFIISAALRATGQKDWRYMLGTTAVCTAISALMLRNNLMLNSPGRFVLLLVLIPVIAVFPLWAVFRMTRPKDKDKAENVEEYAPEALEEARRELEGHIGTENKLRKALPIASVCSAALFAVIGIIWLSTDIMDYSYKYDPFGMSDYGGVTLTGYYGFETDAVIPEQYAGKPVALIDDRVFSNHIWGSGRRIKSVTLPDSIKYIGEGAFEWCTGLTEITLPDGVRSIGDWAFGRCTGLTEITVPDSVTYIGSFAFNGCTSLERVTLPDGLEEIPYSLFGGCTALESVNIPSGAKEIGNNAFFGCVSLSDIAIPDGLTHIGREAFSGCASLSEIAIPGSVELIDEEAFSGCAALSSVNIAEGVAVIEDEAFKGCASLSEITIPESVTHIGPGAFAGCNITVYAPQPEEYYKANVSYGGNVTWIVR